MKNFLMAAGLTIAAFMSSAANAEIITTGLDPDSSHDVFYFGSGYSGTATYGETFTVNADNILQSFSLYLRQLDDDEHEGGALDFRGYIGKWDGSKMAGDPLYSSSLLTMTTSSGLQSFTFNTGNLLLESGSKYVAFLSISESSPTDEEILFGMPAAAGGFSDIYDGGDFVFSNNGYDFGLLNTAAWDGQEGFFPGGGDVAFTANLSGPVAHVPEPATALLLGFGLFGLAANRRRKT